MTQIGMNLAAVTYWTTEAPFVDRIHTAGPWVATSASGKDVTSALKLNADGEPTNLTGVSRLAIAVELDPKGASGSDQYVLTYEGTSTYVSMAGAKIISSQPGKVVFTTTSDQPEPYAYIGFGGLKATDPIHDLHVVRSDQQALFKSGELFNPAFIDKVQQLGIVRFMDWGNTNPSADVSWSTRTTLDDMSWSRLTTKDGVPLEAMVKLANEAHVDMWYNVPTKADDTYVTNALTYIRDHLAPGLKLHVEWSNEVWNGGFAANAYAQNKANQLWGNGGKVTYGDNIYYGYRSAQIADIAHKVFGADSATRLVDVLGGQTGTQILTPILEGVSRAHLGSASSLFKEYAVAPYFGGQMGDGVANAHDLQTILGWARGGQAGLDAAFHELQYGGSLAWNGSVSAVSTWIKTSADAAHAAGLDLVAYEGGSSFSTTRWAATDKADVQRLINQMNNDPRMGQLYSKVLADFAQAGGTSFIAFNDAGAPGDSGAFSVLNNIYESHSTRYDAIMAGKNLVSAIFNKPSPTAPQTQTPAPTPGNDNLPGTKAGDVLKGAAGQDTLDGGVGKDTIVGGLDADKLTGGLGADTFQFRGTDASYTIMGKSAFVFDEIRDFSHGEDKIDLGFHVNELVTKAMANVQFGAAFAPQLLSTHAGHPDVAAIQVGNDTYLFYDSTGHGAGSNSAIKLTGIDLAHLSVSDFV